MDRMLFVSQTQWAAPIISALVLRQENSEFEPGLGYLLKPRLKLNKSRELRPIPSK